MLALLPLHTGDTGRHNRNRGDFQLEPEIEAGYVAQEIARQARSHPKKHDKLHFFGRRTPMTTVARRQGSGSVLERGCEKMSFESKEKEVLRAAIENTDCEHCWRSSTSGGRFQFAGAPSALSQCDAGHASHPTVASPACRAAVRGSPTSTATSPGHEFGDGYVRHVRARQGLQPAARLGHEQGRRCPGRSAAPRPSTSRSTGT